ncbi:hypothetical protein D3C80_1717980 [compost metagenome]
MLSTTTTMVVMLVEGAKFSVVSAVAVVFCSVMTVFQPAPPLAVPFWSHCSSASAPCCTRRK